MHVILVHFVIIFSSCPVFGFYNLIYLCHAMINWFCSNWLQSDEVDTCSLQVITPCSETILYPSSLTTEDNLGSVLVLGISVKEGDAWETQIYFLTVLSEHLVREQLLGYLADNKLNICGDKEAYPHML